jgi:phosphoribosylanthranilate isomerase
MNRPVIKAIEIDLEKAMPDLSDYASCVHAFLFDRPKSQASKHDWLEKLLDTRMTELERWQPYFIAGGINDKNLELALKLNPFGVDLASSVEKEPGKKDPEKLESFFNALQGAQKC